MPELQMATFTQGHALLIGVGADLPNTVDDAHGLADILRDAGRCAYPAAQVTLLTGPEATRERVIAALDHLAQTTDSEATVLLYFSGHGYQVESTLGPAYYLMPFGYDINWLYKTAISGQELTAKLMAIPAQRLVLLLDCCHAGGVGEAKAPAGLELAKSPLPSEALTLFTQGAGRVLIASSKEDELSYAGKPYSAFTLALVEALAGEGVAKKDGYVRVTDLALHARQVVPGRTQGRQHPVLHFKHADNFVLAYYAGGETQPKGLPFTTPPQIEPEPGAWTQRIETRTVTASGERSVAIGGNVQGSTIVTGNQINTGGGAHIGGNVSTGGGAFYGGAQAQPAPASPDPFKALSPPLSTADPHAPSVDFKPWEQRIAPGMSGGGPASPAAADTLGELPRFCQMLGRDGFAEIVGHQTDLVHLPMVERHTTPATAHSQRVISNAEAWALFIEERLYDTRRVTLEHFHLFEWFPLAPGLFHTPAAYSARQWAMQNKELGPDGKTYFNPVGKLSMLRGGIGAVRLRPRLIAGEPHYFMTASSNGVCHEGFPVLIPRRFYGLLKARLLDEGAVAVTVSGEMRYVPEDAVSFFEERRDVPLLYLHVDELDVLPRPRAEVTQYLINVAVSFVGEYAGMQDAYATFAAFDPARRGALAQAVTWMREVYVSGAHRGVVITDFDEVQPRFPQAVFGLPTLMAGQLERDRVRALLDERGFFPDAGQRFFVVYQEINTQGGAYIHGDVHTAP